MSKQLHEIVKVNQEALVANAVNLDMIDDVEKNLRLCKGFVFNYNPDKPKNSTLGILDILRRSFHSRSEENIHLMIQDYGKGKSHFALTIANFFIKSYDTPELTGIFNQIEAATTGRTQVILEELKAYKQRTKPFLVVTITGNDGVDLRQLFLRSLRKTLDSEGITDSIAQRLIQEPLTYLKGLNDAKKAIAEIYLTSIGNPEGDLREVIHLLEEDNHSLLPRVKEISRAIEGHPFDFETELKIQDLLEDLYKKLCIGENRRYQGILILFDEINAYLREWVTNPIGGGAALQNLTDFCANHRGEAAILFFAQVRSSQDNLLTYEQKKSCARFTTRIEQAQCTYEPVSSLEIVLDSLLIQQPEIAWQEFLAKWQNSLIAEGRSVYEKYITKYGNHRLPLIDFQKYIVQGCFPLHPLTTYILCNLNFTQGRTVVQFIQESVKDFLQKQPVEVDGKLNFLYPVELVESFEGNFSQESGYADYKKAYDQIISTASSDEIKVIKALFLFYLCGDKLQKSNDRQGERTRHEPLLANLSGFPEGMVKSILTKLCQDSQVIYHNSGTETYRFFSGRGMQELKQRLEISLDDTSTNLGKLIKLCRNDKGYFFRGDTVAANRFVDENRLLLDEWQFEWDICSIDELEKYLANYKPIEKSSHRGLILQVIGANDRDTQDLRNRIDKLLSDSLVKSRIVIAIPNQGCKNLAIDLIRQDELENMNHVERQEYGEAYIRKSEEIANNLSNGLRKLLQDSTYHCIILDKLSPSDKKNPSSIISCLIAELYPFAPTVERQDKLKLSSSSGTRIVSFIARALLRNDLTPQILDTPSRNVIDPVFVNSWKILKKTSQRYSVQPPTHPKIQAAWDLISDMMNIGDKSEHKIEIAKIWEKLSQPPYGYNEFTFTILLTAWITYHSKEISMYGTLGIPTAKQSVTIQEAGLKQWAESGILEKPKDFINKWVLKGDRLPQLIRRKPVDLVIPDSLEYTECKKLTSEIKQAIQSGRLDIQKQNVFEQKLGEIEVGIKRIDEWLKPAHQANLELHNEQIDLLASIYSRLFQEFSNSNSSDKINVILETNQKEFYSQMRQQIAERIELLVKKLVERAESLNSEYDDTDYRVEVSQVITVIEKNDRLPSYLVENLKVALRTAQLNTESNKALEKLRNKLHNWESQYHNISSIQAGQDALTVIDREKANFSNIGKLSLQIKELESNIRKKIESYQENLSNFKQQIKNTTSVQEARELYYNWLRQSQCYIHSNSEDEYEKLSQEANCVFELLSIQEVIYRTDNIEACRTEFQKLEYLYSNQNNLGSELEQRFSDLKDLIKTTEISINLQQQQEAEEWINYLLSQINNIEKSSDDSLKLEVSESILTKIQSEKSQFIFTSEQKDKIDDIEKICQSLRNRDLVSQITSLFQQLPYKERMSLYNKLSEFLNN